MQAEVVLVIAGFIAFFGFIGWLVWYINKRRRDAWKAVALELDLHYAQEDSALPGLFPSFKLFGLGRGRRAKNVLSGGIRGVQVWLCDYQYVTGYGKHRQVHSQTLCLLKSPLLAVPHCYLRKQNRFFDFMGKLFGGQDINFDEDLDFSKAFVLQGENETRVRDAFNENVRHLFSRHQGSKLNFEARGDSLMVHHGKNLKPADAKGLKDLAFEILNQFVKA